MMTEAGFATIVEWSANENGLNMATNVLISAQRQQWSIDGDAGGMKVFRYFCLRLSHMVPMRPRLSDRPLGTRSRLSASSCLKSDIYSYQIGGIGFFGAFVLASMISAKRTRPNHRRSRFSSSRSEQRTDDGSISAVQTIWSQIARRQRLSRMMWPRHRLDDRVFI